jgi:transposase
MPRFKDYDYRQTKLLPVSFEKQILPGTFEHSLSYLIDHELDLSVFAERYANDEVGRPAYDPAILLKIVLLGYSRGVTSSRKLAAMCEQNVVFMAMSADSHPHFTTIADFVSSCSKEIALLFRQVVLICDELGLIGREMFAIDGCKLPSNASKEWSGTKADLRKKRKKIDRAVRRILSKHRASDRKEEDADVVERERRQISTLRKASRKIREFLEENEEKLGSSGKPIQSNITDNDSAKMKTSHGVVQGYIGVAAVDGKHQVVVHAEAHGKPNEHELLKPAVEGIRETLQSASASNNALPNGKCSPTAATIARRT